MLLCLLLPTNLYADFFDPTQPITHNQNKTKSANASLLTMIFYSNKNTYCIINGNRYVIGDELDQYIVKDIQKDFVVLHAGSVNKYLYLAQPLATAVKDKQWN